MLPWLSSSQSIVVAFLAWNLYRRFGADRIAALNERRRATRASSAAESSSMETAISRWPWR